MKAMHVSYFFRVALLMLLCSAATIAACTEGKSAGETPSSEVRTVTDMLGRRVVIPTVVERLVGIEAGALRLIVYLQAADRVVGVEEIESRSGVAGGSAKPYIIANPELESLPKIGPMHGGDPELILESSPDVILWTSTTAKAADDLHQRLGIPVVGIEYGDLGKQRETFYEALRLVGTVTGNGQRAEYLIDYIEENIDDLRERTSNVAQMPTAYIGGVGYRGAHGILSTEPAYSPFAFVRVDNVASGLGLEHAFIDREQLLEWNPEYIFIDEGGYAQAMENLAEHPCRILDAVREGRLYGLLPYNWYTTNFGTVLANAYYVGSVIYPERFGDIDPIAMADRIYGELVGGRAYHEMAEHFGGFKKIGE